MATQRPLRLVSLFAAALLVLATTSCSSSSSTKAAPETTTTTQPAPTPIGHVFVINLENENFEATWSPTSPAVYLNKTLRPMGQLLTQYFAIGHLSLGNYIAQISGQAPNPQTQADCVNYSEFSSTGVGTLGQVLGQGCVYPASVLTIADQLEGISKTWKSYQEDIANSPTEPKTCRHPEIGAVDPTLVARAGDMYATRHNPFVYFHSVIDDPSCATSVVGLDALTKDLTSAANTPNLSYITPNLCNDGHDAPCKDGRPGGLTSADLFLKAWVPKILSSPAFKADGMLVVTFDEAESGDAGDSTACCVTPTDPNAPKPGINGLGGGRVGALVVSFKTKPGTTNAKPYNHYSLLCSIEALWDLKYLGFAGSPGLPCFGNDVYDKP